MRERIRQIREHEGLSRPQFAQETGIPAKTWQNVENGLQKANEDHLQAIAQRWPEYAYWLMTGKTQPEAGNVSPELDELRKNLARAGGSPKG